MSVVGQASPVKSEKVKYVDVWLTGLAGG